MVFAEQFNSPYYKKKTAQYGRNSEKYIGSCPADELQFMLCKKELKKAGFKPADYEKVEYSYFTDTNGYFNIARNIYFWDVRKLKKD